MAWHAKPSGAYEIGSSEANENLLEIHNILSSEWSLEAIAGMCGNFFSESGMNPWRWQSDRVSLTSRYKGYGLPQFTPAYGYINDYGIDVSGFSPNLSTTEVTTGATPEDGYAQIIVINEDRAGKFLNRAKYCSYADLTSCYPFSAYKQVTDVYLASTGWLFNYEFPADRSKAVANARYANAKWVYDFLSNYDPVDPPTPPEPPTPPTPQPTKRKSMPVYMMCRTIR